MVVLGIVSNLISFAFCQHALSPSAFSHVVSGLMAEGKLKEAENLLQNLSKVPTPLLLSRQKGLSLIC